MFDVLVKINKLIVFINECLEKGLNLVLYFFDIVIKFWGCCNSWYWGSFLLDID